MLKTIAAALIIVLSLQVFVLPKSSRNFLYRLLLSSRPHGLWKPYNGRQYMALHPMRCLQIFIQVTQEELHKVCVNLYEKLTGKTATPEEEKIFTDNSNLQLKKKQQGWKWSQAYTTC